MNELWWLWEGAAVRDATGRVGKVLIIRNETPNIEGSLTIMWVGSDTTQTVILHNAHLCLIPESNPAVMLAPEEARYVAIYAQYINGCNILLKYYKKNNKELINECTISWKGCRSNLKGHTWELPIKPAPGA